jgi:putative two-component system response regulator
VTSSGSESPLSVVVLDSTDAAHENHKKLLSNLPGVGVVAFADPNKALSAAHSNGCDLLIVSLNTAGESIAFLKQFRLAEPAAPIIMITKERELEKELRRDIYDAGTMTLLDMRPIDPMVYLNTARTALGFAMLRRDERRKLQDAQEKTASVYMELEKREAQCLEAMMNAAALVDKVLATRMAAVATISRQIAQQMHLDDAKRLEAATRVYDIGMLALPEALRNRRLEPLNANDIKLFQTHVTRCGEIFGGVPTGLMGLAWAVAASHHERYDGTGYPNGKAADDIPIYGRIVAVAEAMYDATRPVHGMAPSGMAGLQKVQRQELTAFDPNVVAALGRLVEAMSSGVMQQAEVG